MKLMAERETRWQEETRWDEQNILNLSYGQFESSNKWGIPDMLPCDIENLKDIPLQGFNFALTDKHPSGKGVHFFLHDYQFERVWKYPKRYTDVLQRFTFCLSPDFSPYSDMPLALQCYNVYRNRWCGRFWQECGIDVIPTFTVGDIDCIDMYCAGIPKHSTIAVSTMGEGRWANYQGLYAIWDKMLEKLEPKTILLYGKDLSENLSGNIVHKKYITQSVSL